MQGLYASQRQAREYRGVQARSKPPNLLFAADIIVPSAFLRMLSLFDSGYVGAAGRFDYLKEVALAYAFAIKVAVVDGAEISRQGV